MRVVKWTAGCSVRQCKLRSSRGCTSRGEAEAEPNVGPKSIVCGHYFPWDCVPHLRPYRCHLLRQMHLSSHHSPAHTAVIDIECLAVGLGEGPANKRGPGARREVYRDTRTQLTTYPH